MLPTDSLKTLNTREYIMEDRCLKKGKVLHKVIHKTDYHWWDASLQPLYDSSSKTVSTNTAI